MGEIETSVAGVAPGWSPDQIGIPDAVYGYVGGQWLTTGERRLLDVEDPALGARLGVVAEAQADDVARAVESAALSEWRSFSPLQRSRMLLQVADTIRREADTLAVAEACDTGKPLSQAHDDVAAAARYFEYFGGLADKLFGRVIPQAGATLAYSVQEPYGVVAHITPWNSPLSQMCRGLAPSLAVGNTTVVKPSELTPYSSLWCAQLLVQAGLPAGACNVVIGKGATTGAALVAQDGVRHISFTGSVATGAGVMAQAARRIVPCALELGGKSPLIVCADADIERAAEAGVRAVVRNSGQSCLAATRLIVQRQVLDEVVEGVGAKMRGLTLGHPLQDPDLGPLSSAAHVARVRDYIQSALDDGVTLVGPGAEEPEVPGCDGHFLFPSLLVGVRNTMRVAREEVFGPVQSVLAFDELDEAVAIANDTDYGLTSTVFTGDVSTALLLSQQLEAGQVHVNGYPAAGVDVPFGGYKASGLGREKGWEALLTYSQTKACVVHAT